MAKGKAHDGNFNINDLETAINNSNRVVTGRKKKPKDRLSLHACEALNRGMSYGQYMAAFHPTLPIGRLDEPNPKKMKYKKICPICGSEFWCNRTDRMYCSDACRVEANRARLIEGRKAGRVKSPVICIIDGKYKRYDSILEASHETGLCTATIKRLTESGAERDGMVFKLVSECTTEEDPLPPGYTPGILEEADG